MCDILVLVHDDAGQVARLNAAVDLVHSLDGHLVCLDVTAMPPMMGPDIAGGAMLLDIESRQEHRNKAKVTAWLAEQKIAWEWQDCTGGIASAVIDAAQFADLVVLNRQLDAISYPDMRDVTGQVLMHLSIPVIALPDHAVGFPHQRALIAWDGGRRGTAAMRAAVPLLRRAGDVELFTVVQGSAVDTGPAEAYLRRHGVTATVRSAVPGTVDVADVLIAEGERFRADYIVMGGYEHGRTADALFGGVTRQMLTRSPLPLVLAR